MTALQTYRAWENSPTSRAVHIMQLERGDGSAASRLTLTDQPYYDKGVGGVKYHHTYPAPIHCIIEDITSDEQWDVTTFGDIVVANGSGQFDDLNKDDVIGQRFVILRGDPTWSLMETALPYRFERILEGQVSDVLKQHGKVIFRIEPVMWDLDIQIGYDGFPRGYGMNWNVSATLVDAADNEYKFTSFDLRAYEANITVRDVGVELVHPDSGSDYSIVYDSGFFYGNVELASPPVGRITADFNQDYAAQLIRNFQWIPHSDVLDNAYNGLISQSLDTSAVGDVFCMVDGEAAFYVLDSYGTGLGNGLVRKYVLGTPGNLSTQSTSGAPKNINTVTGADNIWGIWVDPDQEWMYAVGVDGATPKAWLMEFGTPGDQATLTLQDEYDLTGLATSDPAEIRANPARDRVWIMFFDNVIHQFDCTPGDISTLDPDGATFDAFVFDRNAHAFEIANDGKNLYLTGDSTCCTWQCELPEPYDISEVVYSRRHFYHASPTHDLDPYKIHVSAASIFCMNMSEFINQIDLIGDDYDLPPAVVETSIYSSAKVVLAGVHYTTLTPVGQAMTDLASSIGAEFAVDRFGAFRLNMRMAPEDAPDYYPYLELHGSSLVGRRGEHIEAEEAELPARAVTLLYRKMQTIQDASELSGLDQDDQHLYSTPHSSYEVPNALDTWVESEQMVIDGYCASLNTTAENMTASWALLKSKSRFIYSLHTNLRCTPHHKLFGVGDIIRVTGDWYHSDFEEGDRLQLLGLHKNFSKEQQVMRVCK